MTKKRQGTHEGVLLKVACQHGSHFFGPTRRSAPHGRRFAPVCPGILFAGVHLIEVVYCDQHDFLWLALRSNHFDLISYKCLWSFVRD